MIDLSRTRARMLGEIEARVPTGDPVHDITDPRILTADTCVRLHGRTREELFPLLKIALSERFAAVPRTVLVRDLLMPLKHALGNAFKHGNGRDITKALTVDVALTSKGAVIAVTDEGDGFDVGVSVRRMHEQETYFVHHGSGFRGLHRATSPVAWENGGRTLLLCFQTPVGESDGASPVMTDGDRRMQSPDEDVGDEPVLGRVLDPVWMHACLVRELPAFRNGLARLASCQPYSGRGPAGDDCGIRCVLRVLSKERSAETRILTARLHEQEATAAADFETAAALHGEQGWKGLRIPEPVARLAAEPRLVLYDFDPWMNLWQYLDYRGSLKALRHAADRAAKALDTFHRSRPALHLAESGPVEGRFRAMVAGAESALERLPGGADLVARFRDGIRRIRDHAPVRGPRRRAPIHGALGWDRIHYGVDGIFYFDRFETCRIGEPGVDLGGYAADLLRFTLARDDLAGYRTCRDDLLASYNARAQHPVEPAELPHYTALAIGERLRDARFGTKSNSEDLLAALDRVGTPEFN